MNSGLDARLTVDCSPDGTVDHPAADSADWTREMHARGTKSLRNVERGFCRHHNTITIPSIISVQNSVAVKMYPSTVDRWIVDRWICRVEESRHRTP